MHARWIAARRLATVVLLAASSALAQDERKSEAAQLFAKAMRLIDEHRLEEAIAELQRAYEIQPHYSVLYNLGTAYAELGQAVEAIATFEKYLQHGGAAIPPDRRALVVEEIARQNARVSSLQVTAIPAGAIIKIDGRPVGVSPLTEAVRLGSGTHVITVASPGFVRSDQIVVLAGQETRKLEITMPVIDDGLGEAERTPATRVASRPAKPEDPDMSWFAQAQRPIGFVVTGLGAAVLGAAAGLMITAQSTNREALERCNPNCDEGARALHDNAASMNTAGIVTLIAGGALGAGGSLLLVTAPNGPGPAARASSGWTFPPGGLALRGAW